MRLIIRKATSDDHVLVLDQLRALYIELGEEESSVQFLDEGLLRSLHAPGRTEIFLAFSSDEAVGLMTITETQAIYAGGAYGVIDEMYVVPSHRSAAVGKALLDKAVEVAREKGWKRLDVTAPTEKKWTRTVDFYKKNGFVFTGPKFKRITGN